MRPGTDLPIVALSPLLPDWGPLKEGQFQDPQHHRLFVPESLDGLERVYDHFERDYERSLREYVGP